ncbi:MAG TPA: hypothetical protein VMU82_04595 [Acetobacteraceae bacterium]|nr:hypothetical protein [Acetobacteraceae bacterium]
MAGFPLRFADADSSHGGAGYRDSLGGRRSAYSVPCGVAPFRFPQDAAVTADWRRTHH